jgi:hypothetical protein
MSFLSVPDSDPGKQAFAVGMTFYHVVLGIFCAMLLPNPMAIGSVVHVAFAGIFILYLQETGYFVK